jgi:hypothetical protein
MKNLFDCTTKEEIYVNEEGLKNLHVELKELTENKDRYRHWNHYEQRILEIKHILKLYGESK